MSADKLKEATKEQPKDETLCEIIFDIKEEFFSDLDPEEIPDDAVSDLDEEELKLDQIPMEGSSIEAENGGLEMEANLDVQKKMTEKYQKDNFEFLINFVKAYAKDPKKAKNEYYKIKVHFDPS